MNLFLGKRKSKISAVRKAVKQALDCAKSVEDTPAGRKVLNKALDKNAESIATSLCNLPVAPSSARTAAHEVYGG